jgi:hypothetical protein
VADLHAFRVAVTLPCKRCRYDLRGLHADGHCPECGLEVLESVAASVDPELALLPSLRSPRLVGASLFLLTLGLAVATVGTSASAAALFVSKLPSDGWQGLLASVFPPSVPQRLVLVPPIALGVASLAAVILVSLAGLRGRRQHLLFVGVIGWLVASQFVPTPLHLAVTGVLAMVTLAGLGPMMVHLGQRSRTYRRAAHAQQATGPLTAATAIGVLSILTAILLADWIPEEATALPRLIAAACLAMINVGFLYLALNGLWISRSLWGWQPLLERVLDRPPPDAPSAPSAPSDTHTGTATM